MSIQSDFRRLMSEEKDLKDLEIEEMSVTGGEAYLPGLDVPEKKYKYGYTQKVKEDTNSGYKEVKGFRAGHTKDKGGFQYKDLWNVNEREQTKLDDFKIGDKVKIDKSVNDSWKNDGFGQIVSFEGDLVTVNVTSGGGSTFARQMTFPKDKLSLQSGEIKKQEKKEKKKEKEMEKEPIKEGIKTEIRVRNKAQQFKEAAKLANKKLREVNSILEFASQIKPNLNEAEYGSSSKLMENMKKAVAEAYKKMKGLSEINN